MTDFATEARNSARDIAKERRASGESMSDGGAFVVNALGDSGMRFAVEQLIGDGYSPENARLQMNELRVAANAMGESLVIGSWKTTDYMRTIMSAQITNNKFEAWIEEGEIVGFIKLIMIDADDMISFETLPYIDLPSA